MIHVHPFPARMAPEIALSKIQALPEGTTVLDPMAGSGMVLSQAARNGLKSFGYDLDPLAHLISRVGATKVNEEEVLEASFALTSRCHTSANRGEEVELPWIDQDSETSKFIEFWFFQKQRKQLRILAHFLIEQPFIENSIVIDVLKVAVSRLIITKEPKASLARDTAHSRPHRTIIENEFDIFDELPRSVKHVLKALNSPGIVVNAESQLGDARRMNGVENSSIDIVITSPPYLNAIDYMRGHRLSLVWFGYRIKDLRCIRGESIGAESASHIDIEEPFWDVIYKYNLEGLHIRTLKMLNRYFVDLRSQMMETHRVLRNGGEASYVIGNSNVRGKYVPNNKFLLLAAEIAGLEVNSESVRDLPDNRRYLPFSRESNSALSARMRTEHIIEFRK
ncbi:hypothetical protein ATG98_2333 [Marinobacter sp. LV10R520-4]|uniref:hypothetical protein n=1 Tax=Marinobacter sp. LV10R520-4 TaxID=1761796 RepID=UPI000BF5D126|nr:hypothetical protein [Marinobacter sp. LV10R520-4]PFG53247.1 hypothetical protein ATG98_2333 [Marinobacter sp. LV10R520-4]